MAIDDDTKTAKKVYIIKNKKLACKLAKCSTTARITVSTRNRPNPTM